MTNMTREQNILALETSNASASLCLFSEGKEVFAAEWTAERSHNSRIFDILKKAETILYQYKPDLILVGAGPGSYSGIRVSLAVADGLGLVYGAPVVAVNSWEALPHEGRDTLVLSDARRGGWALGYLTRGKWTGDLVIATREEAIAALETAKKEDLSLLSSESKEKLEACGWSDFEADSRPKAENLIHSWNSKTIEEQSVLRNTPLSPLYVREPNITPAKRAAWQKGQA